MHTHYSPAEDSTKVAGSLTSSVFGRKLTATPTKVVQFDIFGGFTVAQVFAPVDPDLLAMPVASHLCDECDDETTPVPLSNPVHGWNLYPCHMSECGCCYEVGILCGTCGKVEDHCECVGCSYCGDLVDVSEFCSSCDKCESDCTCTTCAACGAKDYYGDDTCYRCGKCEHGCCSCARGGQPSTRKLTPGWIERGEHVDPATHRHADAAYDFRQTYGKVIDPAQMMSDFYLTEWVSAVLTQRFGKAHRVNGGYSYAIPANNDGFAAARKLAQRAQTMQQHIVHICEDAFATYGIMAIMGEVRYHGNAGDSMPISGRDGAWGWALAMSEKYDRAQLAQDCADLFRDPNEQQWQGNGYGGEKWAIAADVLSAYFGGKLDPRTFVDRTFSLQHNGGSFLNKVSWTCHNDSYMGVSDMQRIGNAHHAHETDFATLLAGASTEVRNLVLATLAGFHAYLPAWTVGRLVDWIRYDADSDLRAEYGDLAAYLTPSQEDSDDEETF